MRGSCRTRLLERKREEHVSHQGSIDILAPFTRLVLDRLALNRLEMSHGVTVALSVGFSRNSVSLSHNQQLQCFVFFQTSEQGHGG